MTRSQLAHAGKLIRKHVDVPPSERSESSMRVALLETLARKQKRRPRRWIASVAPGSRRSTLPRT